MAVIYGNVGIFGIQEKKPLRGFPQGKAKIVMRGDCYVSVFIKTKNGIRKFYVKEVNGFYEPCIEAMANYREVTE